ncbi:MAG TPA: hypothetical protein VEA99_13540 [Gemmatimonadaceae bacterium]|nr:hypothetical protein [Gemmatimonadaceae bacterium]
MYADSPGEASAAEGRPEVARAGGDGTGVTAPRGEPVLEAIDALWAVVRAREFDTTELAPLRPPMRRLAVAGRAAGLHSERVVLLVKESWRSLPEVRRGIDRPMDVERLGRLVSLCIDEYYRDARHDR